ncbi:MAG: hypothetical protein LQ338_002318 [Usnochroma carphineum]|nr:MAG: hypothetical protein LQ338_002318 [Usnochroma carphineum]
MLGKDTLQDRHLSYAKNTGSKECLAQASLWLRRCVEDHTTCVRLQPKSLRDWKPTRLVYVGTRDEDSLRLCEGRAIPAKVKYITLSHRWGVNLEWNSLTHRKLAAWTTAIPDCELMQTFKDAIKVTRSLGLQYIWIDSLCIIQDSKADWLYESSRMSNIYKYSYCNIAATAADSDESGCFCDRDPSTDLPVRFNFSDLAANTRKQNGVGELAGREDDGTLRGLYDLQWQRTWVDEIQFSPLICRAWVVQEV